MPASCATANSPTDHGNKVFLFDLVSRVEMYCVSPESGWPDSYEVDKGSLTVFLRGVSRSQARQLSEVARSVLSVYFNHPP